MKVSKELKIGIYVVGIILIVYWGINFLKGRDVFGKSNSFYAVFENVQGLQQTSHIYIRGLKIGHVESISYNEKNNNFTVKLNVDSKYNIPLNSIAKIYSVDLLGSKAIKIDLGAGDMMHVEGDTLASGVESDLTSVISTELTPIKEKLNTLLDKANVTFDAVNTVLDEKTTANISATMENLNAITTSLKQASRTLDALLAQEKNSIAAVLDNAQSITTNLKNNEKNITTLLTNLANISDSLTKANFGSIAADINSILDKIKSGEGTLGKLASNDSLYMNLNNTANSLDALLKDLKANPGRYVRFSVFGKKDN